MTKQLEVTVTYLEMTAPPARPKAAPPPGKIAVVRADPPTVSYFRYLYNNVGEKYLWYLRRAMEDAELEARITDKRVHVYVMYVNGVPAGFCELDLRRIDEVELVLFGLMPDFIGKGYGKYLLNWTIDTAWSLNPTRVWLHTCTFDHPRALSTYQKAGFRAYAQETDMMDDPRAAGLIPFKGRV